MHGRKKNSTTPQQRAEASAKISKFATLSQQVLRLRRGGVLKQQVLKHSAKLVEANPDFYTVWNYRRDVIEHLSKNEWTQEQLRERLEAELRLTQTALMRNPKSYNAWHQRVWVVQLGQQNDGLIDLQQELALCDTFLSKDSRNFHCWDYRRFVTQLMSRDVSEELQFSTTLIEENFSNFSSWHYRGKLLLATHTAAELQQTLRDELTLVRNAMFTEPDDQSAWLFHRFVLAQFGILALGESKRSDVVKIELSEEERRQLAQEELEHVQQLIQVEPECRHALLSQCMLLAFLERREEACATLETLVQLDPLRRGYYGDMVKSLSS